MDAIGIARGVLLMAAVTTFVDCVSTAQTADASRKPAIVLTAFGTSSHEARKVFDYIDAAARKRYPEHEIRWAFTSQFIRRKLMRQGIVTHCLEEVARDLRKEGYSAAVFQSLHVVPGQEYREVAKAVAMGLDAECGTALLTSPEDMAAVAKALTKDVRAGMPNILAAHGNEHHPEFNRELVAFDALVQKEFGNVRMATVEGQPGDGAVASAEGTDAVHFIPLMVVAGDHIMNDVMGNEAGSWKCRIGARETTCAKPLGYNDAILEVYFQHLDAALAKLNGGKRG